MDYTDVNTIIAFKRRTGFGVLTRSIEWKPLRDDIRAIVATKLKNVPWIPPTVIDTILSVPEWQGNNPPMLLVPLPVPTTTITGSPSPDMPAWLDSGEKRIWWDNFVEQIKKGEAAFNQRQWSVGQGAMRSAQMDARLWNAAYAIAKFFNAPKEWIEEKATTYMLPLVIGGALVLYVLGRRHGLIPRPTAKTNPGRKRRRTKRKTR